MLAPLVVLWLSATEPLPEQRALVDTWAAARDTRARVAKGLSEPLYDARAVEQIEAALENARAAGEAAPDELERAERLLLAHPELPQAAWLLAERYALAAHPSRVGDERAGEAWLDQARALEGGRAQPAGATRAPVAGPAGERSAPRVALALPRTRPRDELFVDGLLAGEPEVTAGPHHVRLVRGGQLVWAGWLIAAAEPGPPPEDPTRACSVLDWAGVEVHADGPHPAPGVSCPRWAAARPSALGGLDVSLCEASSCAAWQHLGPNPDSGAALVEPSAWPGWLTWALVGAGAAATASLVLWQSGAFERSEPSTEFVFTGPSAAAYRF